MRPTQDPDIGGEFGPAYGEALPGGDVEVEIYHGGRRRSGMTLIVDGRRSHRVRAAVSTVGVGR